MRPLAKERGETTLFLDIERNGTMENEIYKSR